MKVCLCLNSYDEILCESSLFILILLYFQNVQLWISKSRPETASNWSEEERGNSRENSYTSRNSHPPVRFSINFITLYIITTFISYPQFTFSSVTWLISELIYNWIIQLCFVPVVFLAFFMSGPFPLFGDHRNPSVYVVGWLFGGVQVGGA